MAKAPNKNRLRLTRYSLIGLILIYIVSYGLFADETAPHELMEYFGYFLVLLCAFGRIYCTAFLGGFKNTTLITHGPFSLSRNPLYLSSFVGFAGIGIMSTRFSVLLVLMGLHLVSYHFLVRREEQRLGELFGDAYRAYCARVPRFIPSFEVYETPDNVQLHPHLLSIAMRDALVWFLAYPLFEFIDYLHSAQVLPQCFLLP